MEGVLPTGAVDRTAGNSRYLAHPSPSSHQDLRHAAKRRSFSPQKGCTCKAEREREREGERERKIKRKRERERDTSNVKGSGLGLWFRVEG